MTRVKTGNDPIGQLLVTVRTIAVVGCSRHPEKDAHRIPAFLQSMGYQVLPVNPNAETILGEQSSPDLSSLDDRVEEDVDVVNVFRPPEDTPPIARAAVEIGAGSLWLQLGITSEEAARTAEDGGLFFVQDRCMYIEYKNRFGVTPLSELSPGE